MDVLDSIYGEYRAVPKVRTRSELEAALLLRASDGIETFDFCTLRDLTARFNSTAHQIGESASKVIAGLCEKRKLAVVEFKPARCRYVIPSEALELIREGAEFTAREALQREGIDEKHMSWKHIYANAVRSEINRVIETHLARLHERSANLRRSGK